VVILSDVSPGGGGVMRGAWDACPEGQDTDASGILVKLNNRPLVRIAFYGGAESFCHVVGMIPRNGVDRLAVDLNRIDCGTIRQAGLNDPDSNVWFAVWCWSHGVSLSDVLRRALW
jgi:hypothetical protein